MEAPETQISSIFRKAVSSYERERGETVAASEFRSISTVDDFVARIDQRQSAFAKFRKHDHPNLIQNLRRAVMSVRLLGNVLAGPASNACPGTGSVFTAIVYLLDAVDNESLTFDTIELLFKKIEDVNVNLDILSCHELPAELRLKAAELMAAAIKSVPCLAN